MSIILIAEAGVNHNGDPDLALRMVDVAAEAGADFVKFQTFRAELLATANADKAGYQKSAIGNDQSQLAMLSSLQLPESTYPLLADRCQQHGIGFLSTAFDEESLTLVAALKPKYLKIPSGELTNIPLLRKHARLDTPLLISTGMATLGEIDAALRCLIDAGMRREQLILLHCTTEYPAPFASLNLKAIRTLANTFGIPCGYSDHSSGIEAAIAAAALGAPVIEKHFTLNRNMRGPDHRASVEPDELGQMVRAVRNVELALGDGIKRPYDTELANAQVARKRIVAATVIHSGDTLGEQNMTTRRHTVGLSPLHWDLLLGRKAVRDFQPDEPIEL
ncbi:MAG: N-acetylneuraminate synthase [Leptospirales bacterium]|nr:N-acetylneuraminate synthase [Leptospirales bacterium]